jgi:hypothetical protein
MQAAVVVSAAVSANLRRRESTRNTLRMLMVSPLSLSRPAGARPSWMKVELFRS